jgi:hypothetical protein
LALEVLEPLEFHLFPFPHLNLVHLLNHPNQGILDVL